MKLLTLVGTRPEIIRLSRIIPALDRCVENVLVDTQQNSDPSLNSRFYGELGIRQPDVSLNLSSYVLGEQLSQLFLGVQRTIEQFEPDGLLVLGDTNSGLGAILARRLGLAVYHLEAGNRAFDANVPEEVNRKLIDHVATFNLAYSEHARRSLLSEGLPARHIFKVGSPLREVVEHFSGRISESTATEDRNLVAGSFFLASIHRQENIDAPHRLQTLINALEAVAVEWDLPVAVSAHPRLQARLQGISYELGSSHLIFMEPLGFLDYCRMQLDSRAVLSDSGSVSEESAILGFPAVSMRDSMERPEALEAGVTPLAGISKDSVLPTLESAVADGPMTCPPDYLVTDTSARVARIVLSTLPRYRQWVNIRS